MTHPAVIYSAKVMHRRTRPAPYRFIYRIFSLLIDIDQLDELNKRSVLFSVNRFNLLSFYEQDHLPTGAHGLRFWAEHVLRDQGIDPRGLRIKLLCFPRILGWVFNPLSIWYCEDAAGEPRAVICEVRNTFGERHCYLLNAQAQTWPVRAQCAKHFHVSPFIDMDAHYHFRLARPDEYLNVVIREFQDNELLLVASQAGERQSFSTLNLIRQLIRVPMQTFKVLAGIHWQALKIWLRGTPFNSKPAPPIKEIS